MNKIQRKDLLKALEIVKPGLANKELIEQTTSFAFLDGNVVTYNDEISICHPIPGLDIEGSVHAEEFFRLIGKLKEDEIGLEIISIKSKKDKNPSELIITSGKVKAGMSLKAEIVLPLTEIKIKGDWHPLPKEFREIMLACAPVCSTDLVNESLFSSVHIADGYIEGCDRYRLLKYDTSLTIVDHMLIPAASAMAIGRMTEAPIQYLKTRAWVHVKTKEGTIFSSRTFKDEYADTSMLDAEGPRIHFPKDIDSLIDKAMVFAKRVFELDETITVTLKNRRLTIGSRSKTGWIRESTRIRYKGDPISFMVAPYLLRDVLSKNKTCILDIENHKLKFEGKNWYYVTQLKQDKK